MITHDYPLDKITEALDILQEHGVISDNLADEELSCWLEARGLTCDDLNNYHPALATTEQQQAFTKLVRASFDSDPREAFEVLAGQISNGFEADATAKLIDEYKETMGLN